MAFLKAKQGAITIGSNDIAVSDISFDTEFDKIEYEKLKTDIINNLPEITIGKLGKVKFEIPLFASGDDASPMPTWANIFSLSGSAGNSCSLVNSVYEGTGSITAYVGGYMIGLDNAVITSVNISHEAGNIPKISFEILGIVSATGDNLSKNPNYQNQPKICEWNAVSFGDLISFNVSYDLKVEKVYTVDNCNPKLVITEISGNVEFVALSTSFSNNYAKAGLGRQENITISNNGGAGNTVNIIANMIYQDVKLGEVNGLTTVNVSGKRIDTAVITFD